MLIARSSARSGSARRRGAADANYRTPGCMASMSLQSYTALTSRHFNSSPQAQFYDSDDLIKTQTPAAGSTPLTHGVQRSIYVGSRATSVRRLYTRRALES